MSDVSPRHVPLLVLTLLASLARAAHAQPAAPSSAPPSEEVPPQPTDVRLRARVAYTLGAGSGAFSGLRDGLDLAAGAAFLQTAGSGCFFGQATRGWVVDGAAQVGFAGSPSILAIEAGRTRVDCFGLEWTVGPALRVSPTIGAGAEARLALRFLFFFEIGARAVATFGRENDGQVLGFVGLAWE